MPQIQASNVVQKPKEILNPFFVAKPRPQSTGAKSMNDMETQTD